MEYKELVCRNCGGHMRVPENAQRIRCEYCETEYVMTSGRGKSRDRIIDYGGRGPLFRAYIPDGWNYLVTEDNKSVSSLAPVCKGLQLTSGENARLIFLPFAYYKNSTEQNTVSSLLGIKKQDYQLDPFSLVCYRRMVPLTQYAEERIAEMGGGGHIRLYPLSVKNLGDRAVQFQQEAAQKMGKQVVAEAGKYKVRMEKMGRSYEGYFVTILAKAADENLSSQDRMMGFLKKGISMMGAMYGIGGNGSFDFGRAFDFLLLYPEGMDQNYENITDRFLESIDYGPVYYALQEEEIQRARQVQLQGAMQRQQNAIRSSQQISRTLSETTDIVNQGCQEHSQRMDEINRKYSEAVRGVDIYTDSDGNAYEADIKYDHIYRNNGSFVGSSNGSLDLGPEWEELNLK